MLQPRFVRVKVLSLALLVLVNVPADAQSPSPPPDRPVDAALDKTSASTVSTKPTNREKVKRWLEIGTLSISTRYRYIRSNADVTTANQLQFQFVGRGRFKFDPQGKYSVYVGLSTGATLTSGWNSTGWGTGDPQSNIYPKLLYFNAKPAKWIELQVGSIAPYNGENTEITGIDNDAYLTGARVQIRAPKLLYFDEITATNAYLGDVDKPNAFRRFKRLDESNYHQVTVRKQLNKQIGFSADYTFESGRDTFHQAVSIKTPTLRALDRILLENYQRVRPDNGYGFGLFGEKKLHDRFALSGGFARIDSPMFNSDRFPPGKRLYLYSSLKLTREFSVSTALIQAVGELQTPTTPRTRLDIIFTCNLLETLRRLKIQ